MKYFSRMLIACMAITAAAPACAATLVPLGTFGGGDGNLAPGDRAYLTADNLQRGLAYNPVTNHLLLVNRVPVTNVVEGIHILDGTTGDDIGMLDLTDVGGPGTGL